MEPVGSGHFNRHSTSRTIASSDKDGRARVARLPRAAHNILSLLTCWFLGAWLAMGRAFATASGHDEKLRALRAQKQLNRSRPASLLSAAICLENEGAAVAMVVESKNLPNDVEMALRITAKICRKMAVSQIWRFGTAAAKPTEQKAGQHVTC